MLQRALGEPDGARRVARGSSLVGLADQHVGHHVWVADLLGPFHRTVGPVRGRPNVAAVLVEPARELGVAGADLQEAHALGAGKAGKQLLDQIEVPADGPQDLMRTKQPVLGAELWERTGEVVGNLAGMRYRNDGRSLQPCSVEGGSGGESSKHLQDGASLQFISPQLPHEHVHRFRRGAVRCSVGGPACLVAGHCTRRVRRVGTRQLDQAELLGGHHEFLAEPLPVEGTR
jgi:hypothetical protein